MFQRINSPNTIFWSSLCFPESTVTFLCFEMSTNLKGFIGILIFLSLVFKNVITSLLTPSYRSSTTENKMSTLIESRKETMLVMISCFKVFRLLKMSDVKIFVFPSLLVVMSSNVSMFAVVDTLDSFCLTYLRLSYSRLFVVCNLTFRPLKVAF